MTVGSPGRSRETFTRRTRDVVRSASAVGREPRQNGAPRKSITVPDLATGFPDFSILKSMHFPNESDIRVLKKHYDYNIDTRVYRVTGEKRSDCR